MEPAGGAAPGTGRFPDGPHGARRHLRERILVRVPHRALPRRRALRRSGGRGHPGDRAQLGAVLPRLAGRGPMSLGRVGGLLRGRVHDRRPAGRPERAAAARVRLGSSRCGGLPARGPGRLVRCGSDPGGGQVVEEKGDAPPPGWPCGNRCFWRAGAPSTRRVRRSICPRRCGTVTREASSWKRGARSLPSRRPGTRYRGSFTRPGHTQRRPSSLHSPASRTGWTGLLRGRRMNARRPKGCWQRPSQVSPDSRPAGSPHALRLHSPRCSRTAVASIVLVNC